MHVIKNFHVTMRGGHCLLFNKVDSNLFPSCTSNELIQGAVNAPENLIFLADTSHMRFVQDVHEDADGDTKFGV